MEKGFRRGREMNKTIHPIRAAIAILLVGTVCLMYATGMEVPEAMIGLAGVAIGFYFRLSKE